MLNLMQGMQNLQQQLLDREVSRAKKTSEEEVEYEPVRGGIELHRLPEWTPDNAPVDLQDWLLLIHPQMSEITATRSDWWDQVMEAAKSWYKRHQLLKPIEKLEHEIKPPAALMQKKWRRLGKRGSSLLLQALPDSQKEDVIASKDLSVLAIVTKLLSNYQPGGSQEKAGVLSEEERKTQEERSRG